MSSTGGKRQVVYVAAYENVHAGAGGPASQAGLIAVGEPTIEKAVDKAIVNAAKVSKRYVDAATDENRRRAARSTLELIRKPPRMRSAVLVEVRKQAGTSGGRSSVVISGQAVPAGPSTITTAAQGPG